jgi:hypothetical protein
MNDEHFKSEVLAWRKRFPQYEYRAQDECVSIKMEFLKFGCHCDLEPNMNPDGCVIDEGRPWDCVHAKALVSEGKGKEYCSEWRQYVAKL